MDKQRQYKITEELVVKFIHGNLSAKEAGFISDALKDEKEKEHFLFTKNLLDEIELNKAEDDFETDKALQRLLGQINESNTDHISTNNRKLSIGKRLLKIAAVFAILVTGILFWKNYSTVEYITLATTAKPLKNCYLQDSSIIDLNINSTLVYPKKFRRNSRSVRLLEGEAYFSIKNQNSKPFIVETPELKIIVLGTKFNVSITDNKTDIIVNEGKVAVSVVESDLKDNRSHILNAGDKGRFSNSSKELIKTSEIDLNELIWQTGKFVFKETSMVKALETIASEFGKELNIISPNIKNCLISATINKTDLNTILETLNLSADINSSVKNDTIFVSGDGCGPLEIN